MSSDRAFAIVGVGASARGVEALEGLFRGLPSQPGMGVIVVIHLGPTRESNLPEILGRFTTLPVHIARHDIEIAPNVVYVLAADSVLGIQDGRLQMRRPAPGHRERKPIDIFFAALAQDRGGLTIAQTSDGFGPRHPDIPNSAIASGFVDFAIPADQMGAKLVEFARSPAPFGHLVEVEHDELRDATLEQVKAEICLLLRGRMGHDFSGYRTRTFLRRVQRRMQVTRLFSPQGYVERLRQDPQEIGALFRDLLINVTSFFRHGNAFNSLATLVIPKLFEGRSAEDTIRAWVPGCSTGEEAFSIAILLREHMDSLTEPARMQIFATDIDERALTIARTARYPDALLDAVSPARRRRFFIADGASYVVAKDVRELCTFSPHSVIRDPPFSRMDLISCRNLLIYFGVDIQHQVIPLLHYALRPGAYLFLGLAENVSSFNELFEPLDKTNRLFRSRIDATPRLRLPLMMSSLPTASAGDEQPRRAPPGAVALRHAVEYQVLDRHAPPHVVVNADGDVVHYSARTGRYLEAPVGMPTRQIVTIARKGLRLDLRSLFRAAVETGRGVARSGIPVETDQGNTQLVGLRIEPLVTDNGADRFYLILFIDEGDVLNRAEAAPAVASDVDVAHADRELRETRDRLRTMIEEYETALEELKSSNEELVSVNEELQSTHEELGASKEELQSVNEALHTVNAKLSGKIESLDQANSDLQSLFESTDVATVFLDTSLQIRSFTPAVAKVFNILQTDRGRPVTDLSSKVALPSLAQDIDRVFSEQQSIERRVAAIDGSSHYLFRLAPYRNGEQKVQGVVVTFVDVTSLLRAEYRQQILIAELQHRTRNLLAFVQAVAAQTFEQGPAREIFATRLAALSRVQGVIGEADGDQVDLGDIVGREVEALGPELSARVLIRGPKVKLSVAHIQTLGLALHELATNAMKYGALREEAGHIEIAWAVEHNQQGADILALNWRESGLSAPPVAVRRGFGRHLIERALAHTMRATTELHFRQDGITCSIAIPLPTEGDPTAVTMALEH